LPTIFEALADYAKMTNDPNLLTEYVRQALAAQITDQYVGEHGSLKVITLTSPIEQTILDHVQHSEHGQYLALDMDEQQKMIQETHEQIEQVRLQEATMIIICSPAIRMHLKQLIERFAPDVVVLSYNELRPDVEVESIGVVKVD